jgi:hypothetical protein
MTSGWYVDVVGVILSASAISYFSYMVRTRRLYFVGVPPSTQNISNPDCLTLPLGPPSTARRT